MGVRSRGQSVHDDTDESAALVQQFLNGSVTQRKTVIGPDGVLNDAHRESVAVGLEVGHSGSGYPSLIKATQPCQVTKAFSTSEDRRNVTPERARP